MWNQTTSWLPAVNSTAGLFFYSFITYLCVMLLGLFFGEATDTTQPEVQDYKKEMMNEKARKGKLAEDGSWDKAE